MAAIPGHRDDKKLSPKAREEGKAKEKEKDKEKAKLNVLVRFRGNVGAAENVVVAGLGGQVQRKHRSGWASVRLPGKKVRDLADHPAVEYVASDSPISAAMEISRVVAGQPTSDLPESSFTGAGVTIAMLDTGVSSAHAEIQSLVASVDLVGTYDPTFAPANAVDPNGHGTHVAGIMVANGSRSSDGRFAGIAPGASLVSVRVLDDTGRGYSSSMLAGLNWVLEHKDQYGIRVINLSLGHPVYEPAANDPLVQAVDALWDAGIVVVCSAGNSGRSGHGTVSSPCNSRKVITVGSLNYRSSLDPADDLVGRYSSKGPTRVDLLAKPDLIAPGNRIVSALSPGSYLATTYPTLRVAGDPYQPEVLEHFELTGTSMAAPLVAGTAALMLQQQPALNPATVKARLMLSARKVSFGDPFAAGAGVLDILGALRAAGEVATAPSPRVFADGAAGTLNVENTGQLWGNAAFSLQALWSSSVLWADSTQWDQPVVTSYGLLTVDTSAEALLWPTATLWAEAMLWPESLLWSETVIWDPDDLGGVVVESLGTLIDDP